MLGTGVKLVLSDSYRHVRAKLSDSYLQHRVEKDEGTALSD